jgi:hypothetical protein
MLMVIKMIRKDMSLTELLNYVPDTEELAMLPLDVNGIVKVIVVGKTKKEVYDYFHYIFSEDFKVIEELFKNIKQSKILEFDHSDYEDSKYIAITEFYPLEDTTTTNRFLQELIEEYKGIDIIFDLFDQEENHFRTSVYNEKVSTDLI